MSEASFWDYLRPILPQAGHFTRIESLDTAPGFPDVHYTLDGRSGTIELKAARNPKSPKPFAGKGQGLRKSQLDWIEQQDRAFGRVWILAEVGKEVFLVDGNVYHDDFNNFTIEALRKLASVQWSKGGSRLPILDGFLTEEL